MSNKKNYLKHSSFFFLYIAITEICTYSFFLNFLNKDQNFNDLSYYYLLFTYIFLVFTFFEFGTNFYSLKNILISKKLDFFYIFLNIRQYLFAFSSLVIILFLLLDIKFFENFFYILILFFSVSFLCHPYQIFLRYKNNFKILFYSSIIQLSVILLLTIYLISNNSLNIISSIYVLLISIIVKLFFFILICNKKYKLSFLKFKNIKHLPIFLIKSFKYFILFFLINFVLRADLIILDYLNFSNHEISIMSLYVFILSVLFLPYMSYLNVLINNLASSTNRGLNKKDKSELVKIFLAYTTFGIFALITGLLDHKFLFISKYNFVIFLGANIIILIFLLIILYLLFFLIIKSKYKECSIILFSIFFLKFFFLKNLNLDNFYFLISFSNFLTFFLVFIFTLMIYNSINSDKKKS